MRLEISGLRVERGGRRVIEGLSFALAPGEALIVTGPKLPVSWRSRVPFR